MKRPKQPPKSPQQLQIERRTERRLDEEIAMGEKRLKAQARGALGAKTLLTGFQGKNMPAPESTPAPQVMPVNYGSGIVGSVAKRTSGKRRNEMRGVKRL